jgi:hypothetical protein
MLKHSSEKLNFIQKKKQNERQSRRKSFSATIPHFPAKTTFWSKFFHNIDAVRGFPEQNFPWK